MLWAGNPREKVVLGSLVTMDAAQKKERIIADAKDKGGKVIAGGERDGTIVQATLTDNVTPEILVYSEESL